MRYYLWLPFKANSIIAPQQIADYQKRLQGRLILQHFRDVKSMINSERPNQASFWALDSRGKNPTSEGLAQKIQDTSSITPNIVLLVGDANGLPNLEFINDTISLGQMTLPHAMIPLIISEQLYRAETIIKGSPYHLGH